VITGEPITGYGPLASYWLLPASGNPASLLNGYYTDGHTKFESNSYAAFGEVTWRLTSKFNLTGGLRYTYEAKDGTYSAPVFGGGTPATTAQNTAKLSILRPQAYAATLYNGDLSAPGGRLRHRRPRDGLRQLRPHGKSGASTCRACRSMPRTCRP